MTISTSKNALITSIIEKDAYLEAHHHFSIVKFYFDEEAYLYSDSEMNLRELLQDESLTTLLGLNDELVWANPLSNTSDDHNGSNDSK